MIRPSHWRSFFPLILQARPELGFNAAPMSELPIQVLAVRSRLEDSRDAEPQIVCELLLHPELLTIANDPARALKAQLPIAKELLDRYPIDETHRRQISGRPQVDEVDILLSRPQSSGARAKGWPDELTLRLWYVRWVHSDGNRIAFFPSLGIEVVAPNARELKRMIPDEVRQAILRIDRRGSLFTLALRHRTTELHIESAAWNPWPRTPKENYEKRYGDEKAEPVLKQVATQIDIAKLPPAYEIAAAAESMSRYLCSRDSGSILVLGPAGSGKTTLINEAIRMTGESGTKRYRSFHRTSGARLVAGQTGFGMWQQRCGQIATEARDESALIYFGNYFELANVGQHSGSSESLASFFRPHLMRGTFSAIVECTPEQLAILERDDPDLLDPMRQMRVEPTGRAVTRRILTALSQDLGSSDRPALTPPAITRIGALHDRYAGYSAEPGWSVQFMRRVVASAEISAEPAAPSSIGVAQVTSLFSKESGIPSLFLDDRKVLDLNHARDWFEERVRSQSPAVAQVLDTLAVIKAGLSRPGRPLASFLYIGPTGVGKTELAKTLAEYLYSSPDRMIRLDMSEFSQPGSAGRLVSAGNATREGILTAQVRQSPFSVILLDEFEKAHPSVFDLFLQVLGEARLTDAAGRLADFSNAVIIMTSNLGAAEYGRGSMGFAGASGEAEITAGAHHHFTEAVRRQLRPEFFNRIDRIIPFAPLSEDAIRAIADREIQRVAGRDGLAGSDLILDVSPELKDHLIRAGFDPRYGARPLKRAIEQRLLVRIARQLSARPRRDASVKAELNPGNNHLRVEIRAHEDSAGGSSSGRSLAIAPKHLRDLKQLRLRLHRVSGSPLAAQLSSERNRLLNVTGANRKAGKKKRRLGLSSASSNLPSEMLAPALTRLAELDGLLGLLFEADKAVTDHEEQMIIAACRDTRPPDTPSDLPDQAAFRRLLLDLYMTSVNPAPNLTLVFLGDTRDTTRWVAESYAAAAGDSVKKVGFFRKNPDKEFISKDLQNALPELPKASGSGIQDPLVDPPKDLLAIAVTLKGNGSELLFDSEDGLHRFRWDPERAERNCLVFCFPGIALKDLEMPVVDMRPPTSKKKVATRRLWDDIEFRIRDSQLKNTPQEVFSPTALFDILESTLELRAERTL